MRRKREAKPSEPAPERKQDTPGRLPAVESGLVRIFGRPWSGSSEFLPTARSDERGPETNGTGRAKNGRRR